METEYLLRYVLHLAEHGQIACTYIHTYISLYIKHTCINICMRCIRYICNSLSQSPLLKWIYYTCHDNMTFGDCNIVIFTLNQTKQQTQHPSNITINMIVMCIIMLIVIINIILIMIMNMICFAEILWIYPSLSFWYRVYMYNIHYHPYVYTPIIYNSLKPTIIAKILEIILQKGRSLIFKACGANGER